MKYDESWVQGKCDKYDYILYSTFYFKIWAWKIIIISGAYNNSLIITAYIRKHITNIIKIKGTSFLT